MLSPSELAPPPPPSSPGVRVGVPEELLGADGLPGPSGGCLQPEPVQPFYQPDHHHTGEAHTRRPRRRAQPVICCGDVHLRTESNSVGDGRRGDGNESITTTNKHGRRFFVMFRPISCGLAVVLPVSHCQIIRAKSKP